MTDMTGTEGANGHELEMSVDNRSPEPSSVELSEEVINLHEYPRITQGFAWGLSIASDICEQRCNIIVLKPLDPIFAHEKQRMPEFSLFIKIAFLLQDVQMSSESRIPHGLITVKEEHTTFYAQYDPVVSLPSGVHRLDHGNIYSSFDADGCPR